jgi:hypothetical protein
MNASHFFRMVCVLLFLAVFELNVFAYEIPSNFSKERIAEVQKKNAENRSPLISENAVEVVAKRAKFSKTYDNRDGSFTDVYSISPLHYRDGEGNWRDIKAGPVQKRAAVGNLDIIDADWFLYNAWYKPSTSQYGWITDGTTNCIGWDGLVNRRQMFRWTIQDNFYDDITISGLLYTFHHALSTTQLSISTCLVSEDPADLDLEEPEDAEYFYENVCWETQTAQTTVHTPEDSVYVVNIFAQKYGLEWRINQGGETFHAVGHRLTYENDYSSDICLGEDHEAGKLFMTYTYSRKKIAPLIPLVSTTPNPFNPITTLEFTLSAPASVKLEIYNATGQKVATLLDGPMRSGVHSIPFDGSKHASGVYFYRFESSGLIRSGKMLLLK